MCWVFVGFRLDVLVFLFVVACVLAVICFLSVLVCCGVPYRCCVI